MKKLLSIITITVLLIACKQKNNESNFRLNEKKIVNEKPIKQDIEEEEEEIEEFLKRLQTAVKNKDIKTINESLKFPLMFSSGGEGKSYINYEEMTNDNIERFNKITEAKLIDREITKQKGYEKNYYQMVYQDLSIDPSVEGIYTITFFILKENRKFKLVSFQEPF